MGRTMGENAASSCIVSDRQTGGQTLFIPSNQGRRGAGRPYLASRQGVLALLPISCCQGGELSLSWSTNLDTAAIAYDLGKSVGREEDHCHGGQ